MEVRDRKDPDRWSHRVLTAGYPEGYPKDFSTPPGVGVGRIVSPVPGIFEIHRDIELDLAPLVIVGGIHGDEEAGVIILDDILAQLFAGDFLVRRNVLLMYGNLEAMRANDFKGSRCIEPEKGEAANLNRCFGRGLFSNPETYAQKRANEMTGAVKSFVDRFGVPDVIDIHQSFAVPTLEQVRNGAPDRSDYTYAIGYASGENPDAMLTWFYEAYSDIVAGVVIADSATHHTLAGWMAREYGARTATFEQGKIGYVDRDTFIGKLRDNLIRKFSFEHRIKEPEGYDVWKLVRSIRKETPDFHFVDSNGSRCPAPTDFLPPRQDGEGGTIAIDGDIVHELEKGERLLFANADVPIGDRAAAVVVRYETDTVPTPD